MEKQHDRYRCTVCGETLDVPHETDIMFWCRKAERWRPRAGGIQHLCSGLHREVGWSDAERLSSEAVEPPAASAPLPEEPEPPV